VRIDRLELVRYGKFTDRVLEFPKAACDFHLIIGPNEAGKSTVRSAVQELLFGIARNSPLDFMHPLNTLRLGATISTTNARLEFHRAKADKKTLRTPADGVLSENVLDPFLGNADRHFFDQMFGLDHNRLIDGGKSILSSTDSIGQTLFQSAAGIDSMGKIRDALIKERDSLYAPRKSAEREFYIAQASLESATGALKASSVRVNTWAEAFSKVDSLATDIVEEIACHKQLEVQRNRLERQRRAAPFYAAVQEQEAQLLALGTVEDLPVDASAMLATAQANLAIARQLLTLRIEQQNRISGALAALSMDSDIISAVDDVRRLDQQRQQYSAHAQDIASRETEIAHLWQGITRAGAELGLSAATPQAMRERLPSQLLRGAIDEHALLHSGLVQATQAARQALAARDDESTQLSVEIAAIKTADVAPTLRASLQAAQAVWHAQSATDRHDADVHRASAALENALKALGPWRQTPDELAALILPGEAALVRLEQDHHALQTEVRAAARGVEEDQAECARIGLAITHYQELHKPITAEMVMQARAKRDCLWQALQNRSIALEETAPAFDTAMHRADELSDRQLESAKEAAELQALRHAHERAVARHGVSTSELERVEALLADFLRRWHVRSTESGISGMALETTGEWLTKRRKALEAAAALRVAQETSDLHREATTIARKALAADLRMAGSEEIPEARLDALCIQAQQLIQSVDAAQIRHDALTAQAKSLQSAQKTLAGRVSATDEALANWRQTWSANLATAGLPPDANVGSARAALAAIQRTEDDLEKIRVLQVDRIEAMQNDLATFASHAATLASRLDASLVSESPATIAQSLAARLTQALQVAEVATRLTAEQRTAQTQVLAAHEAMKTAEAMIEPLLTQAGVDAVDMLGDCIARSDRKRMLCEALAKEQASLLQAGDGLTRMQIQGELNACDPAEVAAELETVNVRLQNAVARRAALAAEKASAEYLLSGMAGSETGATAEAQRQEALAQMSDAAERYVRVATAAKLLSWSIERYREEKQGPMLAQASAVFRLLTLGRFKKLHVDFDKATMTLAGMRESGELVSVAGMSDGTRDQLYFALRIAALDMHLDQATALPFLADDLFINYDDQRCKAGLEALKTLSGKTQVIFLSHHDHLAGLVREVFGDGVNVVSMMR